MTAPTWHARARDGIRLASAEWGSGGPGVLLLHGLAGYGEEWSDTAAWLAESHRVVAPDQRGHGRSARSPADLSREAFVADAAMWIEELGLTPAVVSGQSLGGHTAFLLAARRPDLVRGLVVAEATPEANPEVPAVVGAWLDSWPASFAQRADAVEFFGGDGLRARAWASGLEERDGGLWPAFDRGVMLAALAESASRSYWDEWARIRCPVLVVEAAGGDDERAFRRMVDTLPNARLVEIDDAGHDVHLDQPQLWRAALQGFLEVLHEV